MWNDPSERQSQAKPEEKALFLSTSPKIHFSLETKNKDKAETEEMSLFMHPSKGRLKDEPFVVSAELNLSLWFNRLASAAVCVFAFEIVEMFS